MNQQLKGSLFVIISMFLFSLNGSFVRWIGLDPAFIVVFVSAIALLIMAIVITAAKRWKECFHPVSLWLLILGGFLSFINVLTFYKAYAVTTFANAVLTHYLAPIIAALIAPIFLKERLEKATILALALSILGMVLITYKNLNFQSLHLMGILLGSTSGMAYGFSIVVSKKLLTERHHPYTVVFYALLGQILLAIPFASFQNISFTAHNLFLLVLQGIINVALPSILILWGYSYLKAQQGAVIAYIEVLASILWGFLFFKEIPGINILLGGALIILGGYTVIRNNSKQPY